MHRALHVEAGKAAVDHSLYDKRRYPIVDVREGYGQWVRTYERTVQDEMDLRLLERLETADWAGARGVLDLACGTGRIGAWLPRAADQLRDGLAPASLTEPPRPVSIWSDPVRPDERARRAFLTTLGAALAFRPVAALGQLAKPPRIGWLTSSVVHTRNVDAFRREMQALGYRDIVLEVRAAEGKMDRLPALAAELAALPLDVMVTDGGPAVVAAKRATATIPIVIGAAAIDLVQQGVAASLARPGGNVTGFLISTGAELDGKRLELLREALPSLTRVAVVWNPRNDANTHKLASLEAPARALGVQLESVQARDVQDLAHALGGGTRRRVDAMLALADAYLWSQRERIVALAARHRLPAMYPELDFSESGGLMAYGPSVADNFRRAAGYVDRILKGAKPADLPIEQPAKLDLMINLRTARALGLTIPQSLLVRAAHIVE